MPDYGLPWVPADTTSRWRRFARQPPPVDFDNFYGLTDARLRGHADRRRHRRRSSTTSAARSPCATTLRYGRTRPRLGDHRAALRERNSAPIRDQPPAPVARHDGHDPRPTRPNLDRALRAPAPSATRWRRASSWRARRRRTSCARARRRRSPTSSTRTRTIPIPGPITRTGAVNDGDGTLGGRLRLRHRAARRAAGATGGLRWDRFDVEYDRRRRRGGVVTPFERDDEHAELARRRRLQAEPERQHLRRLRHVVQPVGGRPVADRAPPSSLEPEKSRSFELGTKWDVCGGRLSLTAARLPHREDQRAHPGHQSRRSADGARRRAARGRRRARRDRAASSRAGTCFGGYTYMDSEIEASNTAAEVGNALGQHARATRSTCGRRYSVPWRPRARRRRPVHRTSASQQHREHARRRRATGCSTPRPPTR